MVDIHTKYLLKAHNLANKNFGKTFPNPSVGCIIVKKNKIISQAVTASAGRPHAEEIAIKKAGSNSIGSTMYVTLEPCNHKSKNGSCTDQIINSGIKKIYIAKVDPDLRTNKKSIKKLKNKKIITKVGLTEEKTNNLNRFFFHSIKFKRPFIKVKMACSIDNKIAWHNYKSKWISNAKSRSFAHQIRQRSQAILTTSKTIIKDNPRFTVRKKNKIIKYLPIIIIDKLLKIPLNCNLLKNLSRRRIIIFTTKKNIKYQKLKSIGCEVFEINKLNQKNEFNLNLIMKKIISLNINDILVEAGGIFFTKLLKQGLVDEVHLFKSRVFIGQYGKPMIINKNLEDFPLKKITKKKIGKDVYHHFLMK